MNNSISLFSDGESFIYKPKDIDGFLLLNHNKKDKKIYYKFFYEELGESVLRIEQDKQYPLSLYNLFHKYLTEEGKIEVLNICEFDDDDDEEDKVFMEESEPENLELEKFFGFQYYEETDIHIVKPLIEFYIE